MRTVILVGWLVAGAAVPIGAPAQVYKWVDEKGVTHYGERPPAGAAPSRKLDITLQGNDPDVPPPGCYTIRCQYERLRADRLIREEEWRKEMQVRAKVAESQRPAPTQTSPDPHPVGHPVYPVYHRRAVVLPRPSGPVGSPGPGNGPPAEPPVRIRMAR